MVVDQDLRWFLIRRLAAAGRLGEDEINAEFARDRTDVGLRKAAAARAARPDPAAKEAAWERLIDPDTPLAMQKALIRGLQERDQEELFTPFLQRWVELVPRYWLERSSEEAEFFTAGMYPVYRVDDVVVAAADRLLEGGELSEPARRLVVESRDQTLRLQRAQAADHASEAEVGARTRYEGRVDPDARRIHGGDMTFDAFLHQLPDSDPDETTEWLELLDTLVATEGVSRARFVIGKLAERARSLNVGVPALVSTPYINTIPPEEEPWFPGDEEMERRIRRIVRWNAAVMVTRANKRSDGIGGHLSTYASSASLYEVGFNHFFRGKDDGRSGDQIYYQGHAAPGMYSRAFLEGRLTEEHLDNFRHESGGKGLSSYPHPRLMPDFWEFPTVSMGLGPLNAIYQARFNRYLYQRKIADTSESRVWAFLGDGEMDEPEATAALSLAAREQLDNLVFVVSCNLQRLDGPVRGNSKIIQELESVFRGAGWNVVKVIWAREWDPLLARDVDGVLVDKMNSTNDGQFQKYSTETGAYVRENFFGPDPRLRKLVEHLSDDDLRHLRRGGHDYRKLYSAYRLALEQKGAPTVILAHTVKGWTLGDLFEGRNATHQIKKIGDTELKAFRDKLQLPISDKQLDEGIAPYYHPGSRSDEIDYLMSRRLALGGPLPKRVVRDRRLAAPADAVWAEAIKGSGGRAASTTAAFGAILRSLLRDPEVGSRIVPIIPDEARTFGMDALFREVKIYAPFGQRYEPVDANMVLSYQEAATASCSRRASPRPAPWERSPPPAPRTPRTASR